MAALSYFTMAINTAFTAGVDAAMCEDCVHGSSFISYSHTYFALAASMTILALVIAEDLASTSTRCDNLRDYLIKADIHHDLQHRGKIELLYNTLDRLVREKDTSCPPLAHTCLFAP